MFKPKFLARLRTRPTSVSPQIWDNLDDSQRAFVVEHERLHQLMAFYGPKTTKE